MAFVLFFLILAIDQLTKFAVDAVFLPGESISVLGSFFHLTYVLNPGAAFGLLEHARWFFILAAAALLVVFCCYYKRLRSQDGFFYYGCVALLGGAMGNLIDRIRLGVVIDFFDFRIWPVFNVADVAIVLGVASMIYASVFRRKD